MSGLGGQGIALGGRWGGHGTVPEGLLAAARGGGRGGWEMAMGKREGGGGGRGGREASWERNDGGGWGGGKMGGR